jgi:signal transduction histidine kinase
MLVGGGNIEQHDLISPGKAVCERQFGGFGVGLWIAREIVVALGGTIAVESQPERGATFTVELPRSGPSRRATESPESRIRPPA